MKNFSKKVCYLLTALFLGHEGSEASLTKPVFNFPKELDGLPTFSNPSAFVGKLGEANPALEKLIVLNAGPGSSSSSSSCSFPTGTGASASSALAPGFLHSIFFYDESFGIYSLIFINNEATVDALRSHGVHLNSGFGDILRDVIFGAESFAQYLATSAKPVNPNGPSNPGPSMEENARGALESRKLQVNLGLLWKALVDKH